MAFARRSQCSQWRQRSRTQNHHPHANRMNQLRIHLAENRSGFRPGEILRGTGEWQLEHGSPAIEARLCWFVEVQGLSETRRVETVRFNRPQSSEKREFEFHLPE